jgi:ubiquinone/menaquinone biosynthesis C-methylase UbiE
MLTDLVRERIQASVRSLYFPELWYLTEAWFQLARVRSVLEVGCGIGLMTEALAKAGWRLTCVDPSPRALVEVKRRLEQARYAGDFEQGEPDQLPFANHSFQQVVCINMLELAVNPTHVVREVARVLTPGGRALIATFNRHSLWGVPAIVHALRLDDEPRPVKLLAREDFKRTLAASALRVDAMKERAAYVPGATRLLKLKLPLPGAFVALVEKTPS